jgi:hypothetical protein
MNDMDAFEELRASAKAHHVHFEVRPELQVDGDLWMKVGFEVRVWAVHDKGAHAMPGCRKCHDLLAQLDRIVQWAIPTEERPTRTEIEPSGPILYDSREVPGTDEVAITIRLTHREAYATPVDSCEERCLRQIRERLGLLGIPER